MQESPIGKHFKQVAPNGMVQIVAPATNTNGLILRGAGASPGTGWVNLYASPTAPASIGDLNTYIVFAANGQNTAGFNTQTFLPAPVSIPAGYGLWATASTPQGIIGLNWDLLV